MEAILKKQDHKKNEQKSGKSFKQKEDKRGAIK